jgi:hypothetical protein
MIKEAKRAVPPRRNKKGPDPDPNTSTGHMPPKRKEEKKRDERTTRGRGGGKCIKERSSRAGPGARAENETGNKVGGRGGGTRRRRRRRAGPSLEDRRRLLRGRERGRHRARLRRERGRVPVERRVRVDARVRAGRLRRRAGRHLADVPRLSQKMHVSPQSEARDGKEKRKGKERGSQGPSRGRRSPP